MWPSFNLPGKRLGSGQLINLIWVLTNYVLPFEKNRNSEFPERWESTQVEELSHLVMRENVVCNFHPGASAPAERWWTVKLKDSMF